MKKYKIIEYNKILKRYTIRDEHGEKINCTRDELSNLVQQGNQVYGFFYNPLIKVSNYDFMVCPSAKQYFELVHGAHRRAEEVDGMSNHYYFWSGELRLCIEGLPFGFTLVFYCLDERFTSKRHRIEITHDWDNTYKLKRILHTKKLEKNIPEIINVSELQNLLQKYREGLGFELIEVRGYDDIWTDDDWVKAKSFKAEWTSKGLKMGKGG